MQRPFRVYDGCLKVRSFNGLLNPKESGNGICVSLLKRSIQDLSDHGASKEEWILRFLCAQWNLTLRTAFWTIFWRFPKIVEASVAKHFRKLPKMFRWHTNEFKSNLEHSHGWTVWKVPPRFFNFFVCISCQSSPFLTILLPLSLIREFTKHDGDAEDNVD